MELLQDPLHVYRTYVALKNHFTTIHFNFLKRKTIKRLSNDSLNKRADKKFFYFIAEKLDVNQIEPFFVAQFMNNPNTWIGDIILDKLQALKNYNSWVTRIELLEQNFINDIYTLQKENLEWKDLIVSKNNNYPRLFRLVTSNKINPETYTLLNKLFDFIPNLMNGNENDTLFWVLNLKYLKYASFLQYPLTSLVKITPKKLLDKNYK